MKATLEFNLPEERDDHSLAIHGIDWYLTVWDLSIWLRKKLRCGHEFKDADDALDAARDKLFMVMDERGVNLDMVS